MSLPTRKQCIGNMFPATEDGFNKWKEVWQQRDPFSCFNTYNNFIYDLPRVGFNPTNFTQADQDFVQIFNNYTQKYNKQITLTGRAGYDTMQEDLLGACQKLPACNSAMQQLSRGLTRSQIANNRAFLQFYGCYSPPTTVKQAAQALAGEKQCDPTCNRVDNIKLWNTTQPTKPTYGHQIECQNAVCVIDQVTIDAVDSSVGSINIDQVCNACNNPTNKNVGCTCIISGVNINDVWSQIGGANFSQDCGSGSICLQISANGVDMPVECDQAINNTGESTNIPNEVWIGVILFVIICIVIFVLYIK